MRHPKLLAAAAAMGIAVIASTVGLTRHSSADDLLSTLGLDQYATEIGAEGITFSPALTPAPASPTDAVAYAQAECGSMFPKYGIKGGGWMHVHITGFGWGDAGNVDRDALVFGVDPQAVTGTGYVNDKPVVPPPTQPLDSHHPVWLIWFAGIPDPRGYPCWAHGGGA